MKILLVEDSKTISDNIQKFLSLEHFTVDAVFDWQSALSKAEKNDYDCIVLDIMLPEVDGLAVCKQIRKTSETPIIMTTAKGQIEDKKEAYEYGADDYLVKPFDLEELLLRIKALLKRKNSFEIFQYRDITINLTTRIVTKNSKEISLTIKEYHILDYLLKNYGFPVSRADLVDFVRWGDSLFENTEKLDVYISNLRKKLDKSLIQTIKGFGYKIAKENS